MFENNKRVALFLPDGCNYAVAYYAALFADCTILAINIQVKEKEIAWSYQMCGFSVIITDEEHYKNLPVSMARDEKVNILMIDCGEYGEEEYFLPEVEQYHNEVALLINTSGTTSNPKIVKLSHGNILSSVDAYLSSEILDEDAVFLIKVPFTSAYGNINLVSALAIHATIVYDNNMISQRNFLETISKRKITHVECISSFLTVIAQNIVKSTYDINSLKYIGFGGDVVAKDTIKRVMQLYPNISISQGYGMTEASPLITIFDPGLSLYNKEKFLDKILSVGTAVKNVTLKIEGDMTEGELLVAGPNVMLGYLDNQAETDKVIKDGYLHTGDIAYIDEEGYVYIKGRKKNIIIIGGYNILPEEIEALLCKYEGVKAAYTYGVPDQNQNMQLECKIEVDDNFNATELELRKFCSEELPYYKVPGKILVVDSLERNHTGKIART